MFAGQNSGRLSSIRGAGFMSVEFEGQNLGWLSSQGRIQVGLIV